MLKFWHRKFGKKRKRFNTVATKSIFNTQRMKEQIAKKEEFYFTDDEDSEGTPLTQSSANFDSQRSTFDRNRFNSDLRFSNKNLSLGRNR